MFHAYILQCNDGTYYVGSTNNMERRLYQHNNSKAGAHYTKIRRPVTLVYSESFPTYAEVRRREGELKRLTRPQKESLVNKWGQAPF
ncbi:MAG: Excinuclease subunit domain protein [Candidatus Nomurabacteria bacterium]|jgi:putative endonuclease|nr:Excinuclease subunit domain protein [Candidatus Nomurabacteria bacterium]